MAKTRSMTAAIAVWLGWLANVPAQPGALPPGYAPQAYAPPPGFAPPGYGPRGYGPPAYCPPALPGQGLSPQGLPPQGTMPPLPPGAMPPGPPGSPYGDLPPMDDDRMGRARGGLQVHVEPFIMWYSSVRFPVLVTTGDAVNAFVPGALGEPGTQVLYGGQSNVGDSVFGIRLTAAYTFGDDDRGSIDIGGFITESRVRSFSTQSNGNGSPLISRPFFNPVAGREDADIRAFPGVFAGGTYDSFKTQMDGMEANVSWEFFKATPQHRLGLAILTGLRFVQLNESYGNSDIAQELPAGTGNTFQFVDQFGTRNAFVGGQIGAVFKMRWDNVSFDLTTKLIGGTNSQTVDINGYTKVTDATGASAVDNGQGLFAMPSNVGQWKRDRTSYGGEVGAKLGFQLAEHFRFNLSYTFFGLNNIVRPGDQIDRTVNIQPIFSGGGRGVARPAPTFRETMLNTHSINFGFEFIF